MLIRRQQITLYFGLLAACHQEGTVSSLKHYNCKYLSVNSPATNNHSSKYWKLQFREPKKVLANGDKVCLGPIGRVHFQQTILQTLDLSQ